MAIIEAFDELQANTLASPAPINQNFETLRVAFNGHDTGKADKPIQKSKTVLKAEWLLVDTLYENDISDSQITENSIVDVIPDNADIDLAISASILPKTVSSDGSVKIYAKNLPDDDIGVTINILEKA